MPSQRGTTNTKAGARTFQPRPRLAFRVPTASPSGVVPVADDAIEGGQEAGVVEVADEVGAGRLGRGAPPRPGGFRPWHSLHRPFWAHPPAADVQGLG